MRGQDRTQIKNDIQTHRRRNKTDGGAGDGPIEMNEKMDGGRRLGGESTMNG